MIKSMKKLNNAIIKCVPTFLNINQNFLKFLQLMQLNVIGLGKGLRALLVFISIGSCNAELAK